MVVTPAEVVHLFTADVAPEAGALIALLQRAGTPGRPQAVLQLGAGAAPVRPGLQRLRVRVPPGPGWLTGGLARRLLARGLGRAGGGRSGPPILHVWTGQALAWTARAVARGQPLVVEAGAAAGERRALRRLAARHAALVVICPDGRVQAEFAALGVPRTATVVIPPVVDVAALDAGDRAAARAQLGLEHDGPVFLLLPPVTRSAGALVGVWAAMLLEKIRPDVRVLIPADGRERQRVQRLVVACRHEWMFHGAGRQASLALLLAAADVCVHLPVRAGALAGVAGALAAGRPLVVTPAARGLVVDGYPCRVCRPGSPRDAARQMLAALEAPGWPTARLVELQAAARARFAPEAVIPQYGELYRRLAGGAAAHAHPLAAERGA